MPHALFLNELKFVHAQITDFGNDIREDDSDEDEYACTAYGRAWWKRELRHRHPGPYVHPASKLHCPA